MCYCFLVRGGYRGIDSEGVGEWVRCVRERCVCVCVCICVCLRACLLIEEVVYLVDDVSEI